MSIKVTSRHLGGSDGYGVNDFRLSSYSKLSFDTIKLVWTLKAHFGDSLKIIFLIRSYIGRFEINTRVLGYFLPYNVK